MCSRVTEERERYAAAAAKVSKRGERAPWQPRPSFTKEREREIYHLAAAAKIFQKIYINNKQSARERELTFSVCNCRIGREAAKASPRNKPLLIRKLLTFSIISLITVLLGGKFFRITYRTQ